MALLIAAVPTSLTFFVDNTLSANAPQLYGYRLGWSL
jgi:hypothetical protein